MQVNLRIAGRYLGGSTKITQFSGSMRENRADVPGKNRLAQRRKVWKERHRLPVGLERESQVRLNAGCGFREFNTESTAMGMVPSGAGRRLLRHLFSLITKRWAEKLQLAGPTDRFNDNLFFF